jgi:branched-chain amino acid transport system permease protein
MSTDTISTPQSSEPEGRLDGMKARYGRLAWPLALTGAILLAAGTFLSWSYVATILGNLSVYVYPGQVQLFALVMALVAVVFLLMYRGPLHRLGDWLTSAHAVRVIGIGSLVLSFRQYTTATLSAQATVQDVAPEPRPEQCA